MMEVNSKIDSLNPNILKKENIIKLYTYLNENDLGIWNVGINYGKTQISITSPFSATSFSIYATTHGFFNIRQSIFHHSISIELDRRNFSTKDLESVYTYLYQFK